MIAKDRTHNLTPAMFVTGCGSFDLSTIETPYPLADSYAF